MCKCNITERFAEQNLRRASDLRCAERRRSILGLVHRQHRYVNVENLLHFRVHYCTVCCVFCLLHCPDRCAFDETPIKCQHNPCAQRSRCGNRADVICIPNSCGVCRPHYFERWTKREITRRCRARYSITAIGQLLCFVVAWFSSKLYEEKNAFSFNLSCYEQVRKITREHART